MARDADDREPVDAAAIEQFCAQLFPLQQQAIATAQLAGCRFERRSYERDVGAAVWRGGPPARRARWIVTTEYEIFLPDGTSAGTGEDIYECALIALRILDTPSPDLGKLEEDPRELFRLDPENEQQ